MEVLINITLPSLTLSLSFSYVSKNIRREYDEYVLKKGDFDERVFLEEDAHKQIGTPSKRDGADRNMSDEVSARRALKLEKVSPFKNCHL